MATAAPKSAKPMKKWQACQALGEIRDEITNRLEYLKKPPKTDEEKKPEHVEYMKIQIAEYERHLQALDMAGDALTK